MIRSILAAFSFLTIIPVRSGKISEHDLASAPVWFPLVGFFIGALCLGAAYMMQGRIAPQVGAFLILLVLVVITGGLHIDGLADWADSLAGDDSEHKLRIMKDTHHGSYGLVAIVLLLLGKFIALSLLLTKGNPVILLVAPGLARFSMNLVMASTDYARREGGTGMLFAKTKQSWHLGVAAIFAIAPLFLLPWELAFACVAVVLAVFVSFRWYGTRRLGGFTGDLLGACCEACELALLLLAAAI
jgi:adenosylcobinamide-GDP ribazoletransferase